MKRTFPICISLLLTMAAGAQVASHAPTVFAPAPTQSPAVKVVARVNGAELTDADLLREEYAIFPYARQHNGVPKDLEKDIHAGALDMLIFEELVYQEALRRKMVIPAARMQQSETDFRKTFSKQSDFTAFVQSEFHGSNELLREKIRRSLLIDALLKSEIGVKGTVSAAEVKAFYDQNPARFQHPESYTIQTISVIPPEKANPDQLKEAHEKADKDLRRAKTTKTAVEFGLLAEKISDDDYRVMMGQHKPLPVSDLAPQLVKALNAMKPGDVSDVIQIGQIYTIVRLGEHTPPGATKFESVKAQLEKELQQKKTNQARSVLDKKLRGNAKIEVL